MTSRVLIMETDALSRRSLGSLLKRHGVKVYEAKGPVERVQAMVLEEGLDVVLIGLNGYGREAISIIRGFRESSINVAVILLTDPQNVRLSIEGMKLGAFDALPVPVNVDLLVERISAASSVRKKGHIRRLQIIGKCHRRRPGSLRSFMHAVGLNKVKGCIGVATFL